MDIQGSKFILGQSISKTIENTQDEITMDLSLQPSTNEIIYGPKYDSFTVTSLGYVPEISISATTATLYGDLSITSNRKFVQGFGLVTSKAILNINVLTAGIYNLTIQYLSQYSDATLIVDINGDENTYNFSQTVDLQESNALTITVEVDLVVGENTISLYNNISSSPQIGNLAFTYTEIPSSITLQPSLWNIVSPASLLSNGYVGGIGNNGGYIVIPVTVTNAGVYNLVIRYLSGDSNTIVKIDVNGTDTGTSYTFPKTTDWEISNSELLEVNINLNKGINSVKFYNSPNAPGPHIGEVTFTQQFFNETIDAEDTTLMGTAEVVSGGLVSGIAYGLGKLNFNINAPGTGDYNLSIKYSATNAEKTARIFLNEVYWGEYTFDTTDGSNPAKYKQIGVYLNVGNNTIEIS
ncbi:MULTISPECIES: CBM35 domain-containing protein [Clostridium]|uniref:CBM6 domain-containing protein n=1 Tax=Clostridium botulinum D str. 1873 TaxID=592027 RepID=A0A9N7G193_CLOBO|nr:MULTISPECIES: CBM35 domain-containing protein [Clostridium]ACT33732.1 hypothetical protein CLG_A0008 [Clostridium botulinum D str. 1873]MBO3441354.1 hypothetical protein [Clostridium haemolyticum]QPW56716.1 hypothetical protein IRP61_12165 [Clostridium botulinum]